MQKSERERANEEYFAIGLFMQQWKWCEIKKNTEKTTITNAQSQAEKYTRKKKVELNM